MRYKNDVLVKIYESIAHLYRGGGWPVTKEQNQIKEMNKVKLNESLNEIAVKGSTGRVVHLYEVTDGCLVQLDNIDPQDGIVVAKLTQLIKI